MLRIANLEEIQALLLQLPGLMDLHELRDPTFPQKAKNWITTLEKALERNGMPSAGQVATLRGVLISTERGFAPDGITISGRASRGKVRRIAAAELLRQAGDLVAGVIQGDQDRVREAERICRQVVAVARSKGLLFSDDAPGNHTESLKVLWKTLGTDPDIASGNVSIEGLVGPYDALVILDRSIAR